MRSFVNTIDLTWVRFTQKRAKQCSLSQTGLLIILDGHTATYCTFRTTHKDSISKGVNECLTRGMFINAFGRFANADKWKTSMRERCMTSGFEYILLTRRRQTKTDGAIEEHVEGVFSKRPQWYRRSTRVQTRAKIVATSGGCKLQTQRPTGCARVPNDIYVGLHKKAFRKEI